MWLLQMHVSVCENAYEYIEGTTQHSVSSRHNCLLYRVVPLERLLTLSFDIGSSRAERNDSTRQVSVTTRYTVTTRHRLISLGRVVLHDSTRHHVFL